MANHLTSPATQKRPSTISAAFDLTSSDSSSAGDADNDDIPLPFPAALPRSDFLAPDFQPAAYLSALPHRHQTLEDLRSDLRDRSADISSELLELVNANYTAFLSLGDELRGGDDKVEDVRVALLGFRRAVDDVKGRVAERKAEADRHNAELRSVRSTIEMGRQMVELSERLTALEERLSLDSLPEDAGADRHWDTDESENHEEEDGGKTQGLQGSSPAKLMVLARQCAQITAMAEPLDQDHPFMIKLEERMSRARNTLLLDLAYAVREAKGAGSRGHDRLLKYLAIYRIIDAQDEAVKCLRNS